MNRHTDHRGDAAHGTDHDLAFDAAARAAHAEALQHVSARVQAQLRLRQRAAMAGEARDARPLWQRTGPLLALGGTAALALAIGLRFAGDTARSGAGTEAASSVAAQQAEPGAAQEAAMPPAPTLPDAATATAAAENATTEAVRADASELADATMREIDALLAEAVGEPAEATALAANGDAGLDSGAFDNAAFDHDALAENPDLYLWLASDESLPDAVESL
jgi:hypothetical protein